MRDEERPALVIDGDRVMIESKKLRLSEIASVEIIEKVSREPLLAMIFLAIALMLAFGGQVPSAFLFGAFAMVIWRYAKPWYMLLLKTTDGQTCAYQSRHREEIEQLQADVQVAVTRR